MMNACTAPAFDQKARNDWYDRNWKRLAKKARLHPDDWSTAYLLLPNEEEPDEALVLEVMRKAAAEAALAGPFAPVGAES